MLTLASVYMVTTSLSFLNSYLRSPMYHCISPTSLFVFPIAFIDFYWNRDVKWKKVCSGLKPIFHWKWGSRWLSNANEIYTKKLKCTWPTQEICVWDLTPSIFHWLASGVGVGSNTNYSRHQGLRWLQDTNMLVSPMQNSGVGGIAQRQPPTPGMLRRSGI